jgi:hypothetical protein
MMLLPPDVITQGTMRSTSGLLLPLEHTEVDAVVNGPVATVTVKYWARPRTFRVIGPIASNAMVRPCKNYRNLKNN